MRPSKPASLKHPLGLVLKAAIETVIVNEALVIDPARESGFDIDKLEQAWAAFEAART